MMTRTLNGMDPAYRAVLNKAAHDAFPALLTAFAKDQDISLDGMEWAAEYAYIAAEYFADEYMGRNYLPEEEENIS